MLSFIIVKLSFIDYYGGERGIQVGCSKNILQSCPDTFLKQQKGILNSRDK